MAFGTSSKERVLVLYSEDPALDKDHPDFNWDLWLKTGDLKHAPTKQGMEPNRYWVRKLRMHRFEQVLDTPGARQVREAVAWGLTAVEGHTFNGEPVVLKFKKISDAEQRLTDESLEQLYSPELFGELGARIVELSRLHPTSG
ncbi:MAG TPA: hypothetical protein VD948_06530 [Rhodothermales bacterium]|nr:hypothetical protein [Rhodothermales bacterium]